MVVLLRTLKPKASKRPEWSSAELQKILDRFALERNEDMQTIGGVGSQPVTFKPIQRILLVDDEPLVLGALLLVLEARGYTCRTATDGLEALEVLRQTVVHAIISDLRMPNMSGFELLPIVRRRYPQIGLIVCSAEPEERIEALQLPMEAYLSKGAYTSLQLVTALEKVLQLHLMS